MKSKLMKISDIKPNPDNPRVITDDKFDELVRSIQNFPEMLKLRPIVVDSNMVVLGGNMRLKACTEAGLDKIPVIIADNLTEEQKKEFIVKDNLAFGEWDWDQLTDEWDQGLLNEWGLDFPEFTSVSAHERSLESKQEYSKKIKAPVYEPKNDKPAETEILDCSVTDKLIEEINESDLNEEVKRFLIFGAYRHIIFNYEKIADYYAHSSKEVQELMEKSALVIIDFDKAIENGFTSLSEEIINQYKTDYDEE